MDENYAPSARGYVRDQVELFERSGGSEGNETVGKKIVVMTMRGARSGKLRKVPLMRVERGGTYVAVASDGGAAHDPAWVRNIEADPSVTVQDGPELLERVARRLRGAERRNWWDIAVGEFPTYAEYQDQTERELPVYVLEPALAHHPG
jgi:deazaflavin-dependent oxidoreductase (nitroreductase family)